MNDAARNGVPLSEDQARRIICTNLAELLTKGACTVRVRRLADEERVTFQAEHNNKWESKMEYQGASAQEISRTLIAIGPKRNKDLHIASQSSGNHEDVTIGFHKETATLHRSNLYQYIYGQLFWD